MFQVGERGNRVGGIGRWERGKEKGGKRGGKGRRERKEKEKYFLCITV